jgi:hypothetical protein
MKFIDTTKGQIPLDTRVIVRWNTRDTAVDAGRGDEVGRWKFKLFSLDMMRDPAFKTWNTLLHCWSEGGMWKFSRWTR